MSTRVSAFNSALETGVRALAVLEACYPSAHDLSRLTQYDYLVVHSGDANGPPSLHPPLPLRSGELLVRRGVVEAGLQLMISRSLACRKMHPEGILYCADETATPFFSSIKSPYITTLRQRAKWVAATFDIVSAEQLDSIIGHVLEAWTIEFQPIEPTIQPGLLQ